MATGVTSFVGSSKFSSDFQQVLQRAVSIAALPMTQMQKAQDRLNQQRSALQGLQSAFSSLQSAISNIQSAAKGTVRAAVSDNTVVAAHTTSGALDGAYSIEVTNIGAVTTTLSNTGLPTVTDPSSGNLSGSASFTLTLNGSSQTITPSGNSLQSLATAINDSGLGVQATIVNIGSNSSPDYRLSLASTHYAADTIQLNDGSTDLLSTLSTGSNATYKVNGLTTPLSSDSRTITLAPGLTVDLLKASPGQSISVNVSHDYSVLENGLSNLASAYNAASQALGQQRGKGAGPLAGQSVVFSLEQTLRDLTQYDAGSGSVLSMADLGFTLSQEGILSFDNTAFSGVSLSGVQAFLGDSTTPGFLKAATDALTSIADKTTGSLESSITSLDSQIERTSDRISQEAERLTNLQATLQKRLADADAAIAVLEGQVTYMTSLFNTLFLTKEKDK